MAAMISLVFVVAIVGFVLNLPEKKISTSQHLFPSDWPVEFQSHYALYAPPPMEQKAAEKRAKMWALVFMVAMGAVICLQGASFYRASKTKSPPKIPVDALPPPPDPFFQDLLNAKRLLYLKNLLSNELISDEEYQDIKNRILSEKN